MEICKTCGVELETGMEACPLCGTSVRDQATVLQKRAEPQLRQKEVHSLKRILAQVASVLLTSAIIATTIIDSSLDGRITWSQYPATICLILLTYTCVAALSRTRVSYQLMAGWVLSSLILLILQQYTAGRWAFQLAFPILCAVNILVLLLLFVISRLKAKGLNILAAGFIAIAVLCLGIDGIISYYDEGVIRLGWSVIVAASLLPVTAAIIFMHIRLKNNVDIRKIFHT